MKLLLKAVVTFYIVSFLGFLIQNQAVQFGTARERRQQAHLEQLQPRSMDSFVESLKNATDFPKYKLKGYVSYYQKILEYFPNKQPDPADTLGILGYFYFRLDDSYKSIKHYQKALEINPRFFWFDYNLGLIYRKNNEYERSIESLQKAAQQNIKQSTAYIMQSQWVYLPIISQLTQLENQSTNTDSNHLDITEKDFIIQQLMGAKQTIPLILILNYYDLNEFEMAFDLANEAIKNGHPAVYFTYFYAALSAYQLKQYDTAEKLLLKCIAMQPKHPDAFYYLSLNTSAMGNEPLAQEYARRYKYQKESVRPEEQYHLQNEFTLGVY